MSYADDLQAVSVDEALIETTRRIRAAEATTNDEGSDVSGRVDHAVAVAEVIRARVKSATGCTGM
jgi:DNA repair protein REV1